MEIRRAQECDIPKINELLYEVAKLHAQGRPDLFKTASKKYTDGELAAILHKEKTPVFVAVEEGEVVGYAFCVYQITENSLLMQERKTLYIDDICVDERARGRKIGTRLYEYVVAFAKEQGFDAVTLNVWECNQAAYKFYQKLGMTTQKRTMEMCLIKEEK